MGDTLVVGAPGDNDGGDDTGAIYVLVDSNSDGTYSNTSPDTITEINDDTSDITLGDGANFGHTVAFDGQRILVGAPEDPTNGSAFLLTDKNDNNTYCLLYTSPSPRDRTRSRMPSSA